jgi:uncharacterized membrane protein
MTRLADRRVQDNYRYEADRLYLIAADHSYERLLHEAFGSVHLYAARHPVVLERLQWALGQLANATRDPLRLRMTQAFARQVEQSLRNTPRP